MGAESRFKHVRGPCWTFESICMNCLLAVGICSSEEKLSARENQHVCAKRVDREIRTMIVSTYFSSCVDGSSMTS
jgi:hypothetical protein